MFTPMLARRFTVVGLQELTDIKFKRTTDLEYLALTTFFVYSGWHAKIERSNGGIRRTKSSHFHSRY